MTAVASFPYFDVDQTLISQYANSPNLVALVEDFGQYFDPTANLTAFFNTVWNIDTAIGFGLDTWGIILGVSRVIPIPGENEYFGFYTSDVPYDWQNWGGPGNTGAAPFFGGQTNTGSYSLVDSAYRTLLLAKALANICETTPQALNALLLNLFPGQGVCYTVDNRDMTMSYVFDFPLSLIDYSILAYSGVMPHPAGVLINVIVEPTSVYFGFQEALPGIEPFGQGIFYSPA
jgi:Protein of unknown function (DUF2612)